MILRILDSLAATLKITEKQAILKAEQGNETLKNVFRLTYNKQIMFYIKQIPELQKCGNGSLLDALCSLEADLASRKFTGHAGRDRLQEIMESVSLRDQEVIRRVVLRDLECGAGTSLGNKTWKNIIPETPQCLCTPYSDKAMTKIKFPCFSQLKADGSRGITDLTEHSIKSVTRAGNEYQGLTDIQASLRKVADFLNHDFVIDGEFIYSSPGGFTKPIKPAAPAVSTFSLDSFMDEDEEQLPSGRMTIEELMEVIAEPEIIRAASIMEDIPDETKAAAEAKREESNGIVNKSLKGTISDKEQQGIIYQVWDLVEYDVYYGFRKCETPYSERLELLSRVIKETGVTNIQVVPSILVKNRQEANVDYNNYRNDGKEGSVLKNVNFLWRDARVSDQVKLKNKTPIDLRIVGLYVHKKDPNKVGGFIVEDESGMARCNTGSGLTDTDYRYDDFLMADGKPSRVYIPLEERGELDREYIMANANDYIGAIVEMEVDGLQKSKTRKKGEPEYSFFLPIIKKIRKDKNKPNDIRDVFADLF